MLNGTKRSSARGLYRLRFVSSASTSYVLCICMAWEARPVALVTPMIRTSIWFPFNRNDTLCWGISLWRTSGRSGCYAANRRLPCWEATAGPVKQTSLLWVTAGPPPSLLPSLPLTSPRSSLAKIVPLVCNYAWFLTHSLSVPLFSSSLSRSLLATTRFEPRHCPLCCLPSAFSCSLTLAHSFWQNSSWMIFLGGRPLPFSLHLVPQTSTPLHFWRRETQFAHSLRPHLACIVQPADQVQLFVLPSWSTEEEMKTRSRICRHSDFWEWLECQWL